MRKELIRAMFSQVEIPGYEMKTTFWSDFTIADYFGIPAIRDTFENAFQNWKTDKVYITELTMVLNWKAWEWSKKNDTYCNVYNTLWEKADSWCMENLKGEDLMYFLRTTD